MKRLLLLPFVLLMPAAHAVDYVKCDAMNRALQRAWSSRYGAEMRALRNDSAARSARDQHPAAVVESGYREVPPPPTFEQAQAEMKQRVKADELRRSRARSSPEVKEWDQRIAKINSDIKKEGCP